MNWIRGAGFTLVLGVSVLAASCGGHVVPRPPVTPDGSETDPLLAEGQQHLRARGVPYDLARARDAFERACSQGSQRGCALLAEALRRGPVAERAAPRALSLSRSACAAGDPRGCSTQAWIEAFQADSRAGWVASNAVQRRACEAGEVVACRRWASTLTSGPDATEDEQRRGLALYRELCDRGEGEACASLGRLYYDGNGVEADAGRAFRLFERACQAGSAYGCVLRGDAYDNGRGTEQDVARAASSYRRACAGGEPYGCHNLARLYASGTGVPAHAARALALDRRACDEGVPHSCNELGLRYATGSDVDRDPERAVSLYSLACEWGSADGCSNWGEQYANGDGVARSDQRAAQLYRLACDQGSTPGCANAGAFGMTSRGGPRDARQAAEDFGRACEGGHEEACNQRLRALVRAAWDTEGDADLAAGRARALASYERACDLGYDSACLQRDVMEGRPVPGARYWEFEILEAANAPSWIQVGDVCAATVMTGANLVRLRVTCGGRYIYPPTSVIHWRGADAVVDDHTTTQNRDARLIMDAVAGTFLLEDDDAGFLPSIRLRGRLVEGAAPEPAR